jgi:hypothetical protein
MPYGRVVSDAVIQPNGKVLLFNGASRGRTGGAIGTPDMFAEAMDVFQYDPYAPDGLRWTVLARTPIRRCYHSTAFLLPSGKVSVQGTDQAHYDDTKAYEHRVETFTPPWFLNGTPRPVIVYCPDVANYNQQVTMTFQGNFNRISLMALGSGTHGVEFTQRLVWLREIRRQGNQVVFQTPPDQTIAIASTYMLFLVNGDAPSEAKMFRLTEQAIAPPTPGVCIGTNPALYKPLNTNQITVGKDLQACQAIQGANYMFALQSNGIPILINTATQQANYFGVNQPEIVGNFRFSLQADGNMVVYNGVNQVKWTSDTTSPQQINGRVLEMQGDGNLVMYGVADGNNPRPVYWSSNTVGFGAGAPIINPIVNPAVQVPGVCIGTNPALYKPLNTNQITVGKDLQACQAIQGANYMFALQSNGVPILINTATQQANYFGVNQPEIVGNFRFSLQADGNMVVYNGVNQVKWTSDTTSPQQINGRVLEMQGDGNLVIYGVADGNNPRPVYWSSNTVGFGAAAPIINPILNPPAPVALACLGPNPTLYTIINNQLLVDQPLTACQAIASGNYIFALQSNGIPLIFNQKTQKYYGFGAKKSEIGGPFRFVLQSDANMVVYAAGNGVKWASDTGVGQEITTRRLEMQGDGNLVMYGSIAAGNPVYWASASINL